MNQYVTLVVNGVCNGMGTGIGAYLATRYALKHVEVVEAKVKEHTEQLRGLVRP